MKKFLVPVFFLMAYSVFGQIETDRNDLYLLNQRNPATGTKDSARHLINLGLGFHLNSNAVTNDFLKGLLYQGFIDNAKKDQVTERLKDENRGGYDFNAGLTYQHRFKPDLAVVIGLNQRQQFNAGFSKDIFELTFRGNKQYVGKHAQLSPLKVDFFDYQSLFIGVQKNLSPKVLIGGGISFIRGGRFNTVQVDRGTLYTDTAGTYLDFDMKFKLAFTESDNFFSSNGLGAAINFNLSLLQEKGQLNFEVRDLGFIQWNNLNTYEGDARYRYDGVEVNNILDFNDSTFTRTRADSIAKDLGVAREEKNFSYLIPATFHLNYVCHCSEKTTFVAGLKYMINANYIPRVYLKGIYYLRKDFFIAPTVAYGGFGRMDFELGAAKSFKDKCVISANIFYLEYILMPKKSSGQGFNFSLTKLF